MIWPAENVFSDSVGTRNVLEGSDWMTGWAGRSERLKTRNRNTWPIFCGCGQPASYPDSRQRRRCQREGRNCDVATPSALHCSIDLYSDILQ